MMDDTNIMADSIRAFVERIEQLECEKKDIGEQIKDVFAEAKGTGFDVPALREIVRRRRQDPETVAEKEAVLEIYLAAMGMS